MLESQAIGSEAMRTILRAVVWVLLAPSGACVSPTLPLPPPEAPTLEPGADIDHIKLVAGCGGAESDAVIVIVNSNSLVPGDLAVSGSLASPCGAWDAVVYAHSGDTLEITQEFGETRSPPTTVQVR
jgi:hypothetical protein